MLESSLNTFEYNSPNSKCSNYKLNTSQILNSSDTVSKNITKTKNRENKDNNITNSNISENNISLNPLKTSTNIDLFTAVEYNDINKVSQLLSDPKIKLQINELNEEGISILHIAVIKANIKMIDLLLSNGADPNILSFSENQTPMHLAYLNQNSLTEEIINELKNYNADENILDIKNKKPIDYLNTPRNIKNNNYGNVDTGNTVITMENQLDSFLTTNRDEYNKEDNKEDNKSYYNFKINNININCSNNSIYNSKNTVVQTPIKLQSEENDTIKNDFLSDNKYNKSNNNNKDIDKGDYTFGKVEDYLKFQGKNKNYYESSDKNNSNSNCCKQKNKKIGYFENNSKNIKKMDINSIHFDENDKINNLESYVQDVIPDSKENVTDDESEEINDIENNNNIEKNSFNNNEEDKNNLNDSLENRNSNIRSRIVDYSLENNKYKLYNSNDSLEDKFENNNFNFNLVNKDNNIKDNSINNNSILTYSNSCIRSKKTVSPSENKNLENENIKNINTNLDTEPFNNLNENSTSNDDFLAKIIKKKRNTIITKRNKNTRNRFLFSKNNSFDNVNNTVTTKSKFPPLFTIQKNDMTNICYNTNSFQNETTIHKTNTKIRFSNSNNSQFSTQSRSNKNKFYNKDKKNVYIDQNNSNSNSNLKEIREFNYMDETNKKNNNNNNDYFNKNYNNIYSNKNDNEEEIFGRTTFTKYWLNNLGLINYYPNFANKSVYDIYKLINKMKSYETRLTYEDFDNFFKIRIPGHIYRILCRLEADAGLIDDKIVKFLLRDGNIDSINIYIKDGRSTYGETLKISNDYLCYNCCGVKKQTKRKNDLKYFLKRYGIMNMYQNFYHNGFEKIEYVFLQMYSSTPINNEILENHFHIYNDNLRDNVLKAIVSETRKINEFLNSSEYNDYIEKESIKYDNITLEKGEDEEEEKFIIQNKQIEPGCNIC